MEASDYLEFVKKAAEDQLAVSAQVLSDTIDNGDRILAQKAASAMIDATSLLIRADVLGESASANPTEAAA